MTCESLIVATGELSIPSMGSNSWGYKVAEQFGLGVHPLRTGLVVIIFNRRGHRILWLVNMLEMGFIEDD